MSHSVKVKYSIGLKLSVIISVLIVIALGTITFLVSYLVGDDVRVTAESNNLAMNGRSSGAAESEFAVIRANSSQLLDLISAAGSASPISKQAEAFFFDRNQTIAAILVWSEESLERTLPSDISAVNRKFFLANELDRSIIKKFFETNGSALTRACAGEVIALNAAPFFQTQIIALLFPWKENGRDQACIVFFSVEALADNLSSGYVGISYMINDSGDLLVHPDFELIRSGVSFSDNPLVKITTAKSRLSIRMLTVKSISVHIKSWPSAILAYLRRFRWRWCLRQSTERRAITCISWRRSSALQSFLFLYILALFLVRLKC